MDSPETKIDKKKLTVLLLFFMLISSLSSSFVGPLIPVFTENFNIGYDRMGLIIFLGGFSGILAITLLGRLSDKFGRKSVLVISTAVTIAGVSGILLSNQVKYFIVSYCILYFGFAGLEVSLMTSFVDISGKTQSNHLIRIYLFSSLGTFIAPILIFFVFFFNQDWKLLFVLILVFQIFFLAVFLRLQSPIKVKSKEMQNIKIKEIITPMILLSSVVLFFTNGMFVQFGTWFTTYFLAFGIKVEYSSLILSLFWLSALLGRLIMQKILVRVDGKKIIPYVTAACMIILAVISFSDNLAVKIIFAILFGFSVANIHPILFSIVLYSNPDVIGSIYSFLGFVGYGGSMLFQLISGYTAETFGKESVIYIQLACSVLCFVFTMIFVRFIGRKANHIKQ
jgi:MFS family permease